MGFITTFDDGLSKAMGFDVNQLPAIEKVKLTTCCDAEITAYRMGDDELDHCDECGRCVEGLGDTYEASEAVNA